MCEREEFFFSETQKNGSFRDKFCRWFLFSLVNKKEGELPKS